MKLSSIVPDYFTGKDIVRHYNHIKSEFRELSTDENDNLELKINIPQLETNEFMCLNYVKRVPNYMGLMGIAFSAGGTVLNQLEVIYTDLLSLVIGIGLIGIGEFFRIGSRRIFSKQVKYEEEFIAKIKKERLNHD